MCFNMNSKINFSLIFIATFLIKNSYALSTILPFELKTEYLLNPLSIENLSPRLSWKLKEVDQTYQNLAQSAYQILVASDQLLLNNSTGDLWDSNKVLSSANVHILYNGVSLKSRQRCHWKVRVWDQNDSVSDYSFPAKWEMGLLNQTDWTAKWITAPNGTQENAKQNLTNFDLDIMSHRPGLTPALYTRKNFHTATANVKEARVWTTARGLHLIYINGNAVSDSRFSPGWTDYDQTIQYQTYDVTQLLRNNSENTVAVILGTGWYSGHIGQSLHFHHYGTDQQLLFQMLVEYENNDKLTIESDTSWSVTTGPVIYSDLLMGELYYESRVINDWLFPEYQFDSKWLPVVDEPINASISLIAERSEPVRVTQELNPLSVTTISDGVYVFDFRQNMAGWAKLKIRPELRSGAQQRIRLRYAEVLYPNGSIYTLNLRHALATDTIIIDSSSNHSTNEIYFEPLFTYHGFRYVELTGFSSEPLLTDIVGRVAHSDTPFNGKFESSSQMVNKLAQNIVWGQRANFFSIPTDCPQRDERLGWTGDSQVFARTAAYNADVAAFYTKWMRDMRDAQTPDGAFGDKTPKPTEPKKGAPAWGDAGVIIPYTVYYMYSDKQIIEENYESMVRWIEYISAENADFLWRKRVNAHHGDWLEVNATTPQEVLSTAYYAYDALLMSRMANATNRAEDYRKYVSLHENISKAFNKAYVNASDARIKGDTQTVYLLALAFELLPTSLHSLAVQNLVENIEDHDWHLTTGFIGVTDLLPVLTKFGRNDVAYRLLLSDTYPSWGYSIKMGATTIWERWDGWTEEKGFQTPTMNSFNHYSLGSVGSWLYQYVAGIDTDGERVGFEKTIIKPNPSSGLSYVKAEYNSARGLIRSNWQIIGDRFILNATIPPNTRALVDLTFADKSETYEIGSGSYQYTVNWKTINSS